MKKSNRTELNWEQTEKLVTFALEERNPFEIIKKEFGLSEKEVLEIMKKNILTLAQAFQSELVAKNELIEEIEKVVFVLNLALMLIIYKLIDRV